MTSQKITEQRVAFRFWVAEGKCANQTIINIFKDAEIILKSIEKWDVSLFMNERSILLWMNLDVG